MNDSEAHRSIGVMHLTIVQLLGVGQVSDSVSRHFVVVCRVTASA